LTREQLAKKRRDQGPYTFACQMLQDPKADETQGFREEWLRYYDNAPMGDGNVYLLFDPASGKRKNNDYTSAWALRLGQDRNYYVIDMVRDRLNLTQRAKLVIAWHRKYRPQQVRYEKYGMMADIEHIKAVQELENYRFDIEEVGGQVAKPDRIKRLIPLFEQKRVYLPRSLHRTNYEGRTEDLVQTFIEQEYKAFPVAIHDDMLDALARIAEPELELVWPEHSPDVASLMEYEVDY
jgi:predicted phage terminase large subunit-like protein